MGHSSISTLIILCNFLLLVLLSPSSGASDDVALHHANKLIRDLNLFPDDAVNVVPTANSSFLFRSPNEVVEKRLRFPNLVASDSEPSVEDLGHHAGYYPIQHSHAARCVSFQLHVPIQLLILINLDTLLNHFLHFKNNCIKV